MFIHKNLVVLLMCVCTLPGILSAMDSKEAKEQPQQKKDLVKRIALGVDLYYQAKKNNKPESFLNKLLKGFTDLEQEKIIARVKQQLNDGNWVKVNSVQTQHELAPKTTSVWSFFWSFFPAEILSLTVQAFMKHLRVVLLWIHQPCI